MQKTKARRFADLIGAPARAIENEVAKLTRSGYKPSNARKIVQAVHDLAVLGGDDDMVIDAFAASRGRVAGFTVVAICAAGVDAKALRAILGDAIRSSGDLADDVDEGIKRGTTDSTSLLAAALMTITGMTGHALGGLAIERAKVAARLRFNEQLAPA